jgi:sporulation protein YlmC with PRC-barrel domain
MTKTYSRALSGKNIMSTDGKIIGLIKNITVDLETGQVVDLIVKPNNTFDTTGFVIEGDRIVIPFEAVKDIKDYIVVDRYLAKK